MFHQQRERLLCVLRVQFFVYAIWGVVEFQLIFAFYTDLFRNLLVWLGFAFLVMVFLTPLYVIFN